MPLAGLRASSLKREIFRVKARGDAVDPDQPLPFKKEHQGACRNLPTRCICNLNAHKPTEKRRDREVAGSAADAPKLTDLVPFQQ